MKIKNRNSNIEMLRIIATIMVVLLHCLNNTGALLYTDGANYWAYWTIEAFAIVAVNVFVLISGYFLFESKFSFKAVVRLAFTDVWFYCVLFSTINLLLGGGRRPVGTNDLLRIIFPILTKRYWFINSYIALYVLSPFLNKGIRNLSQQQHSILIVILGMLFSVRLSFFPLTWSQDQSGGMSVFFFVELYVLAAYLKKYGENKLSAMQCFAGYFLLSIFLVASKKIFLSVGLPEDYTSKFFGYASVFVVVQSLFLFLFALKFHGGIQQNEVINQIAKHSYSVFIIHVPMQEVLFTKIIPVSKYISKPSIGVVMCFFSATLIYIVCAGINMLKMKMLYRVDKIILDNRFLKVLEKVENTINN